MIDVKEIEKLAELARIKIDDSEKKELAKEIDSILAYVDQIKKTTVNMDDSSILGDVSNVFREDVVMTTSEEDRQRLLKEAPDRVGDFIAVKKMIS